MEEKPIKYIKEQLENCTYEELQTLKEEYKSDSRKGVQNLISKTERAFEKLNKMKEEHNKRKKYELELLSHGYEYIAGIDEVGRGPLAGPVYAAAVILNPYKDIYGVRDSKKLSKEKREELSKKICEDCLCYCIASASVEEIDTLNILNATKLAMKRAIQGLKIKPQYILIDALRLEDVDIPQTGIIKGDDTSISIGAASIIAKVKRDEYMDILSTKYPQYHFESNKGYGTKEHTDAIKEYGPCEHHRRTFIKNFI